MHHPYNQHAYPMHESLTRSLTHSLAQPAEGDLPLNVFEVANSTIREEDGGKKGKF